MSNPLLRPNDPRFRKEQVVGANGKNRFGDEAEQPSAAADQGEVFLASAVGDERPYSPAYEAQQSPRSGTLLLLAAAGWMGAILGVLSLAGLLAAGWLCPLLGIGPAAAAWLLAYEDLKAISQGAIDRSARPRTLLAMWLGIAALVVCLAFVGWMIYWGMQFLPDLL